MPGLYVLGATPACGKTTFCRQLLNQLAALGELCFFCSYEMAMLELFTKSISREMFKRDRYCEMKRQTTFYAFCARTAIRKTNRLLFASTTCKLSRLLKTFQRETNTTFIVISSFNRVNYYSQVSFESFKDSGNIEYTADDDKVDKVIKRLRDKQKAQQEQQRKDDYRKSMEKIDILDFD